MNNARLRFSKKSITWSALPLLQGPWHVCDVHFATEQGGQPGDVLRYPAELQLFALRGLAPVVLDPLVEYVRAQLALDELEGAGAHHLLAVERFAPGVPARLALDHQVRVGGEGLDELWRHLSEVEDDLVVIDDLHRLCHFPGHLF